MPLNIDMRPTFTRQVKVEIPRGRDKIEADFLATFEAIDNSELESFDLATPDGTKAFLNRVIVGLDDVLDGDGNAVPYSETLRDRLLDKPWSRSKLVAAYARGVVGAAEGN